MEQIITFVAGGFSGVLVIWIMAWMIPESKPELPIQIIQPPELILSLQAKIQTLEIENNHIKRIHQEVIQDYAKSFTEMDSELKEMTNRYQTSSGNIDDLKEEIRSKDYEMKVARNKITYLNEILDAYIIEQIEQTTGIKEFES